MAYWRMQLHPGAPEEAVKYTVESLAAEYIGLGFSEDVPDLMTIDQSVLPEQQRNYWSFAHEMEVGDHVLLFAHHFPFALVQVAGRYKYVPNAASDLGVWFRHLRKVKRVLYYGDFVTNVHDWDRITMTETISPLRDRSSASYKVIERWLCKR